MPNKNYNIVISSGFTCTGSSALIDVLREIDSCSVLDEEFQIFSDRTEWFDLIRAIQNDDTKSTYLIKKYKRRLIEAGKTPSRYNKIRRKILSLIIDLNIRNYKMKSFNIKLNKGYNYATNKFIKNLSHIANNKIHNQCKLDELSRITNEYFITLCKYIDAGADIIVFNQTLRANNNTLFGLKILDTAKLFIVDRDPRDVYTDLISMGRLDRELNQFNVEYNHKSESVVNDFVRYYKYFHDRFYTNVKEHNRLFILKFEDLVMNYEKTLKCIYSFLNCNNEVHNNKMNYFNPDNAKRKVGMWKKYSKQDEIDNIKSNLKDYCYL